MKKRFLAIISIVLLLVVSLFGCNKEGEQTVTTEPDTGIYIAANEYAKIWAAPNTVSIMQDISVEQQCEYWGTEWLDNANNLYCEGIKGDGESTQLIFTAKKDISSFYFTASDLVKVGSDAKILKENIEVLAERYIEVKTPSSQAKKASMFTGWYPDALVPISSYKARKENKVSAGKNQGIWLNIEIPEDAEAGEYKADCILTLDGSTTTVPLTVKVYDVTMPQDCHIITSYGIWYDQIGYGEDYEDEDENYINWDNIYYNYLLSKRVTPANTLLMKTAIPSGSNCKQYLDEIIESAKNPRISGFNLPYKTTSTPELGTIVDKNMLVQMLTVMAEKNIELRLRGDNVDLFKKAYWYLGSVIDEPNVSRLGAVRYCDLAITEAKAEVAPLLDAYPDLKSSLLHIRHVVTTRVNDVYANDDGQGGIQTWCCETQNYTGAAINSIEERQNSTERYDIGEDFWIYMTCNSNNPVPSIQLDDNLMSIRCLYWMNYRYNITGNLYWNTCYYSKYAAGSTKERDIWNDPLSWEAANGDGYLLYPGTRYGLLHPLSTLRLESLRQAIEDYEYLYMFGKAVEEYNAKHSTSYNAKDILSILNKSVFYEGTVQAKTNVSAFLSSRTQLLELLDAVSNDKPNAGELLESYTSQLTK